MTQCTQDCRHGPGAWVVKVAGGPSVAATVLVLVSDVEAVVKTSRDQVLVFVEAMKTGEVARSVVVY